MKNTQKITCWLKIVEFSEEINQKKKWKNTKKMQEKQEEKKIQLQN